MNFNLKNDGLNSFYEYLIGNDYYFEHTIIENYLLSIKSNPFVLIVGKSAIGKSSLPLLFSRYLSNKQKHEDIILNSVNSLGKSYSNKEWHLKREVISEILPILPFEGKECPFTVNDSFSSIGKFKIDPRFKFTDKNLINHLIKMSEENPNQDVNLRIKVGEKNINSSFLSINNFKEEIISFNEFIKNGENPSLISQFLNNSKKNQDNFYFILVENIKKDEEFELINFFNFLEHDFNISEHNNLFIIVTCNTDNLDIDFSNSLLDRLNVLEITNSSINEYLSGKVNNFPDFQDLNYLEFGSEIVSNLSISDLKKVFQDIWCDNSDIWSLISQELILINNLFLKENFIITFKTIKDILSFMFVSWKYEGEPYNWTNWEKYFDIQIKQKLLPKINQIPFSSDFFSNLILLFQKRNNNDMSRENVKYPNSYLKIKNMESSLNIKNFSYFNSYNFIKYFSDIKLNPNLSNKKTKKAADKNLSKFGSNIYKYGEFFTVNKQINRKHLNFGKFDTLDDATFIKHILVENDWKLSRIKNSDCIYQNNNLYWIIKVFKNKLHILGKFYSYDDAKDHVDWLTEDFKNNENFKMYIPKKQVNENNLKDRTALIDEIKGWEKLVFKAINEIEGNVFSLDDLKQLDIFKAYQFEDESLESIIVENLNKLSNLNLIEILSSNYYKKAV